MDDTAQDAYALVRADLLRIIDQNTRGSYNPQIRTLMGHFGFSANQRVRQSSLAEVTRLLADWGIGHSFPNGTGSMDTVRLFRAQPSAPPPTPSSASIASPAKDRPAADQPAPVRLSPVHFAFAFGDAVDNERSHALCEDAMGAIWQSKPTLLFVEGPEEFFTLLGGYVGALMRRRELTQNGWSEEGLSAPTVLGPDELRDVTRTSAQVFPRDGSVYLVRDVPNDLSDDERVAFIRETFIPHTYRVRARFASTSASLAGGSRAMDASTMSETIAWLAAFAGIPHTQDVGLHDGLVDLSSLLAEATQVRDSLMQRAAWDRSDDALRSGAESSEHVVLKNLVAKYLRQRFPDAALHVERSQELKKLVSSSLDKEEPDTEDASRGRARPDVRSVGHVTVEVETLRGLASRGSSPFVALEQKLRRKLSAYADDELWIVVPNDLALLAEPHMQSVVDSLNGERPSLRVRLAVMDLHRGEPAFVTPRPRPKLEPSLRGASWRESRRIESQPITWNDVAGYSDLKERLQRSVVDPLRDPGKYARYGVGAANGVLLYGLPGCGKSYVGRVLASEAGLVSRCISPSDLNGVYIGESTSKIRELFDWAMKQHSSLLILDEIDAVAPQRKEHDMHTDEKRAVNELLTQLDRISGKPIVVVGTTNYFEGIDNAVRRSGRFDVRIPVFPPRDTDRKAIFDYYLSPARLRGIEGLGGIDTAALAAATPLFSPVDIRAVVASVCRDAVQSAFGDDTPVITELALRKAIRRLPRSIQPDDARRWLEEAEAQLGHADDGVKWLREEITRVE